MAPLCRYGYLLQPGPGIAPGAAGRGGCIVAEGACGSLLVMTTYYSLVQASLQAVPVPGA